MAQATAHEPSFDSDPAPLLPDSPDKAWTRRALLAQSLIWITAVSYVAMTGILRHWKDATYLHFSTAVAAPCLLVPALSPSRPDIAVPWHRCYWFKLNLWIAIVVFFGTYFGTHYFFDLMGMRYAFEVEWTFDSAIVGHSGQRVPLFMYPLTHAYFVTYFVTMLEVERRIVNWWRPGIAGRTVLVIALAYGVAFLETFFMASELLSDLFAYEKHDRMLLVGSLGYASYFVVGLPMVRRIDNGELWKLDRVLGEALTTCMAILLLLEAWSKMVGKL